MFELFVGEVFFIGLLGEGVDMLIVGVGMGMICVFIELEGVLGKCVVMCGFLILVVIGFRYGD